MNPEGKPELGATFFSALVESLAKASDYNRDDMVAPAVVLWTDKDRQWEPLADRLRAALPHLLTLGDYDPASKAGPAIWLRCMIGRTLPETDWSEETTPILYLPGVSRQELRGVEDCPAHLQPLAALQYLGVFWTQVNAKDWTILAFLQTAKGGLGLDVARDAATQDAMRRALPMLADTLVSELSLKRLEAEDFNALVAPDAVRSLLKWLNDPKATRDGFGAGEWEAFRSRCKSEYDFDPQTDGEIVGAEQLGSRQGNWRTVWDRFAEAPKRYPHIPDHLRMANPPDPDTLFCDASCWPQDNDRLETELRAALETLPNLAPHEAASAITKLEETHGQRRAWVWAELGQAALAIALEHLAVMAQVCQDALGGATLEAFAEAYVSSGWKADAALLDALASVQHSHRASDDAQAVQAAVAAVYQPWLAAGAARFQELAADTPRLCADVGQHAQALSDAKDGCCVLFADGLRFDVAQKLKAVMDDKGWQVEAHWRWVALPPVTPTAKPAVSPVADLLGADSAGEDFRPAVKETGKLLTIDLFRQLLGERGFDVLRGDDTGNVNKRAWTEAGSIDSHGHKEGWKLAWRIGEELRALVDRIRALLEAGWEQVRIVTDHGWLLLPGGMPKVDMPSYLAEARWGRCAVLKSGSSVKVPTMMWHWSPDVRIALAPGISCFKAGLDYAHGSLSVQECLIPEFIVRAGKAAQPQASIQSIKWVGLRCRVQVDGVTPGLRADIRTKPANPETSIVPEKKAKAVGKDGSVALFVEDDSLEGTAAAVVLVTTDGRTIVKQSTMVGG
ncbi:MAG: BREX-1 system phosphatase PglZ type B [Planctomycetota bacterium]